MSSIKKHRRNQAWVEPKHSKTCFIVNDSSSSIWVVGEYKFLRNKTDRAKDYYVFVCNDPSCEARLIVQTEQITGFVQRLIKKGQDE